MMHHRARRRLAFATWRQNPGMTADDALLASALARHDIHCEAHPWDATVRWDAYDAVMIRSTWDFHLRAREFDEWLSALEESTVPVINPVALLRWNASKHYLKVLNAKGIRIVPTAWVSLDPSGRAPELEQVLLDYGWVNGAVVKPAVSASANETFRVTLAMAPAHQDAFAASLRRAPRGLMIQPFVPEILVRGEWSLLFFGGQYSHAVLKTPAVGDFRVQRDFGGYAAAAAPSTTLIADATRVVAAAAASLELAAEEISYARVDGVERDGRLVLMEFEGIEPVLFLEHDHAAPRRLATVVATALSRIPA